MKLLKVEHPVKTVIYHGMEFQIPVQYNYIASNQLGWLWAFETEPINVMNNWHHSNDQKESYMVAEVDLEGMDWKESIVKVS